MVTIRCGAKIYRDIEAVLFDKDGTLADSAPYLVQLGRYRAEAVERQVPGVEEQLLRAFGFGSVGDVRDGGNAALNPAGLLAVSSRRETETAAATYVAAAGWNWHEAVAIAQAAFQSADQRMPRKAETTTLFPEARPLLQALNRAGCKLGIISADITPNIDDFVACQAIAPWIDVTWGSDRTPAKPNPAAYRQVCIKLGVSPEKTLMLGDAEGDMSMAKGAGTGAAIGVLWGWPHAAESLLSLPSADVTLRRWDEFFVL